jgi:hypothetical protein
MNHQMYSRREALKVAGFGMGSLALSQLFAQDSIMSPLAPRQAAFPGTAKRVIHLFMNGGPSQVDTFDPKPLLKKLHGKTLPGTNGRDRRTSGVAFASPFEFKQHGQSGLPISELFPNLAQHADDLCVIRSMVSDVPNHEPGLMMMNTGSIALSRPSVGSWLLYGLGTENQSLPGFVVMCPKGLPTAQSANWRNAFLPGVYQGTHIDTSKTDPEELISNIRNNFILEKQQRRQLSYIQKLNRIHRNQRDDVPQLDARIETLELAFRMQTEALDAFDVSQESAATREMYGDTQHGRQTLMARRLVERGVRYVQVYHGAGQPWDSHNKLVDAHGRLARESDQPVAALLTDLKQRGMLDDTLVIWGGEMGRTPTVQLPMTKDQGRDHHTDGFSVWMAGGGVKGGMAYGSTDDVGLHAADNPVHVHDLHATILHLMGFDHELLTYRYAGRDFRLTDVHGRVVRDILA